MSESKLIMPKQTGQLDAFLASLKILYESKKNGEKWYSNKDFQVEIQKELPYLSKGAKNGPYLVKQSELTRYFGLVLYDYSKNIGMSHITEEGVKFYEAYIHNDKKLQIDIIMNSILNNSFGRNNTAIKSSDSDIDPPKLFLKASLDLNGITVKGLAYLLYVTHNLHVDYNSAIQELSQVDDKVREIPISVSNKYKDVKFTLLLKSLGIVTQDKTGKYYISKFVQDNYSEEIQNLSIYNKVPKISLTLTETYLDEDNKDYQKSILNSFVYDIKSKKFKEQNNRKPQSYKKNNHKRYKTNLRIAKTALDIADYKCLINENHKTFISKLFKQYMEAHHLIPMAAQKDFKINIDRIENIVSLCPICHSAIHLGNEQIRYELLKKIYDIKISELKEVGINISFDELFSKYYK